ncbi:putative bifunctional diguanylate cyclase/phosphodiesterase [Vannielia litorea]|uniref:Diguanylate cyclase/phosphodiesterase n=1 Tax=Vannielia litorea TaxID=1217970 RepID=A0A1N6ID92_9RHOB|nr:bifunctional diguanylate cyclase/phosphodiesterase [Vannielia litorea]SIO29921.1 diguanylate cyclase/phosphodiesterase [Vannielia litorea]
MRGLKGTYLKLRRVLRQGFFRPQIVTFLPALMLAGYWFGGEGVILIAALLFPVLALMGGLLERGDSSGRRDGATDLLLREDFLDLLGEAIPRAEAQNWTTACFVLEIDDWPTLVERVGKTAAETVLRRTGERIESAMRGADFAARLDGPRFAVGLDPVRRINLDTALGIAERLQGSAGQAVSIDATSMHVSVSVGFCLHTRAPQRTANALLAAAEAAADEARANGPGGTRAYSREMQAQITARHALVDDLLTAFSEGQIKPWFQPQISTDTGRITGMEALARWLHPERGMIAPGDFLPAIEQAGLMERLGEVMLHHSCAALRAWDRAGVSVPTVGVNFAAAELRNPKLCDRVKWELDRFDLRPERITIEVLESVVADTDDDTITRNIANLATMGCPVDLDDFGTGHASISSIRRFAVSRLKIDRSFVMRVHEDREQQKMVSAILLMAEQLDLDTLAEGVESIGEHAMLAQLGCGHIQGFGLARPMPFEDTIGWIEKHNAKIVETPILKGIARE